MDARINMNCARIIWYPHSKHFRNIILLLINQKWELVSFLDERGLSTSTLTELCLHCPWLDLDFKPCGAYYKLLIKVNCCSCRTVAVVFTFTRQDRNSWMAHCIQLIFWCVRILVWQTYLNQDKNTLVRKLCVHYWKKCKGWLVSGSSNGQNFLALILMCSP